MSYRGDCEANGAPIWTPPCLGGCAISVYPTSRGEAGSWKPLKLDLGEGVSRGWPPFAKRCLNSSAAGERFIATSGLGSPATDGVRNATNAHRDNFEMDSRSETEHAKNMKKAAASLRQVLYLGQDRGTPVECMHG